MFEKIIFLYVVLNNLINTYVITNSGIIVTKISIILKINAPPTPQIIICFLFFGTKLAAIDPMMIALSAVKIILINIICVNIISSSSKVFY